MLLPNNLALLFENPVTRVLCSLILGSVFREYKNILKTRQNIKSRCLQDHTPPHGFKQSQRCHVEQMNCWCSDRGNASERCHVGSAHRAMVGGAGISLQREQESQGPNNHALKILLSLSLQQQITLCWGDSFGGSGWSQQLSEEATGRDKRWSQRQHACCCLLYTSDAADEERLV